MRQFQAMLLLNLAMKLLAVGLAVSPFVAPDLPQFQGKAMVARALTYPLATLLIPALWWTRGRPLPYPHLPDILVVPPFVIDMGGNALNLYDTVDSFDLFAHWLN